MMRLELYSEPFARTGNIAAEGFRKLLGRPALGLLQMVLREAIQNSIDAGRIGTGLEIAVRYRTLEPAQRSVLADHVLSKLPAGDETRLELEASLAKCDLRVMEICDFRTTGLGGPTRADAPSDGDEELDFVNFMRNVGAGRDIQHGGGTYGYGKTSLYAMSACTTIVVDTQTTHRGSPVRRLMGCHLGAAFNAGSEGSDRRRFTGRHWWGVPDGEGSVDPVTGAEAAEIAAALGLPERDVQPTGTSILIIDPHLSDQDEPSVADEIVETIIWNFWPRMTATTPAARRLDVRVEIEGRDIAIPAPEDFPPLDLFAAAMAEIREAGSACTTVRCGNPQKDLGTLAIKRGFRSDRKPPATREGAVAPDQAAHIALMRPVELVVKYIVGEAFPDRRFEWAGVFVCSREDEVEAAFASAEPPAHDDWVPDMLQKGPAKRYVNVALRRLVETARTYAAPVGYASGAGEKGPSLAAAAARLGNLLDNASAKGPGRKRSEARKPGGRKQRSISAPEFVRLEVGPDDVPLAVFEADLRNDGALPDLRIQAEPFLVMDGGATDTDDLPTGYETGVVDLSLADGNLAANGPVLTVGAREGVVTVRLRSPRDAAVGVRMRFLEEADA